jgi:hypothetical protein
MNRSLCALLTLGVLVTFVACQSSRSTGPESGSSGQPLPNNSMGGTDVGNGGEGAAAVWKSVAEQLTDEIRKIQYANIDKELFLKIKSEFPALVKKARIEFKNYPLLLGIETVDQDNPLGLKAQPYFDCLEENPHASDKRERDAINYIGAKKIKVNKIRLSCIARKSDDLRKLVLHEYLGLMGVT